MFGLRDVEVLREVVRRGGFRAAAAALGLSQSAVSNRIMALERALGVALFDRSRRKAELTVQGRRFLEEATRLIELRDRIAAPYAAGESAGTLRLGVAETIVHTRMGDLLRRLARHSPELRIELAVESSPRLARMLSERALDLTVLMTPFVPPDANARRFGLFELGWYVARADADAGVLDAHALAQRPIVTFARETLPYREVARLLSDPDLAPPLLHGSASLATVLTMVIEGMGVGTLPRAMAAAAATDGRIREVATDPALALSPLHFSIAWLGELPTGVAEAMGDARD